MATLAKIAAKAKTNTTIGTQNNSLSPLALSLAALVTAMVPIMMPGPNHFSTARGQSRGRRCDHAPPATFATRTSRRRDRGTVRNDSGDTGRIDVPALRDLVGA